MHWCIGIEIPIPIYRPTYPGTYPIECVEIESRLAMVIDAPENWYYDPIYVPRLGRSRMGDAMGVIVDTRCALKGR